MATVAQVELKSGTARRTCWVSVEKKFKIGDKITLKNSEDANQQWNVISISNPMDARQVHTDWKVGGL